ncbi:MAG: AAA family ATPase [Verrucomicrobiales bacterium]|nr:AAA family ATPase [Verrucomicrobiales bacterium]
MSLSLDALRLAAAQSPTNLPLLMLLADACLADMQVDEARQTLERVLALEPRHALARVGLARVAVLEGKTSEAVVRLEKVLEDESDCGEAMVQLSRLLVTEEGEGTRARQLYQKALELDRSLADEALERDLNQLPPDKYPTNAEAGGKRGGVTAGGDFMESWEDEDHAPRGGAAFDLGLSDFERPKLKFSDVGGMEDLKEMIRMKILYPMQHSELFKAYGKKMGGGVLLYGPPGCGKTLISKATAGEIQANFIALGLHQILDMWIGNSEKRMHEVFELARKNAPCVLFFDEVDALAADRRDLRQSAGRNLINQFLAEMDGAEGDNEGVLVLGATNAPWHIDPAFRRPGRFDRALFVPPPDAEARAAIATVMARGKPMAGFDPVALAKKTPDFSGADLKGVFDLATETVLEEAMKTGKLVPLTTKLLQQAATRHKPTTKAWFESAKNYAMYSNQAGFYDEVLQYLGLLKKGN